MPHYEPNEVTKLSSGALTLEDQRQDLRGHDVYDRDGNLIGSVEDLYVDPESQHEVRFLDVGGGGVLGIGEKHFLIPIEAVAEANEDRVTIAEDQETLKSAPDVSLNPVITPDEQRRLYDYYGTQTTATATGSSSGSGSAKDKAKQQSQEIAQQTQQQASQVAEQGREQAKGQIATQKERAAEQLEGVAQALQQTGQQLREQDQGSIGQYADQAAEQIERFSGFLRERDADQLIGEAESFARRQPALFLGGAFALGVLGARFLKASSSGQSGNQTGTSSGEGNYGATGGEASAASSGAVTYGATEGLEPSYESEARSPALEGDRELDRERDLRERTRGYEE